MWIDHILESNLDISDTWLNFFFSFYYRSFAIVSIWREYPRLIGSICGWHRAKREDERFVRSSSKNRETTLWGRIVETVMAAAAAAAPKE